MNSVLQRYVHPSPPQVNECYTYLLKHFRDPSDIVIEFLKFEWPSLGNFLSGSAGGQNASEDSAGSPVLYQQSHGTGKCSP